MKILDKGHMLQLVYGNAQVTIGKSLITLVDAYRAKYLRIWTMNGFRRKLFAKIAFEDVTDPYCVSLQALEYEVKGYLKQHHKFVADDGQTYFDCGPYFKLNDNFYVDVNGVRQSWGFSRTGDIAIVANIAQGDEVIVSQPNIL